MDNLEGPFRLEIDFIGVCYNPSVCSNKTRNYTYGFNEIYFQSQKGIN
uniref:Uncharacterized protein n=1 Tax=Meloidogyne enterolobii TaxID=390850 RepID=A0A6V7W0P0_MELEN|nr:unnamed protein product [Meloidogyne enterolobii]